MEVHKHRHQITHEKKWGEYVLEFLMIFFAVFLGFIAENIREHYVERKKKTICILFVNDLQTNTTDLETTLKLADVMSKKILFEHWFLSKLNLKPKLNIDSIKENLNLNKKLCLKKLNLLIIENQKRLFKNLSGES